MPLYAPSLKLTSDGISSGRRCGCGGCRGCGRRRCRPTLFLCLSQQSPGNIRGQVSSSMENNVIDVAGDVQQLFSEGVSIVEQEIFYRNASLSIRYSRKSWIHD